MHALVMGCPRLPAPVWSEVLRRLGRICQLTNDSVFRHILRIESTTPVESEKLQSVIPQLVDFESMVGVGVALDNSGLKRFRGIKGGL